MPSSAPTGTHRPLHRAPKFRAQVGPHQVQTDLVLPSVEMLWVPGKAIYAPLGFWRSKAIREYHVWYDCSRAFMCQGHAMLSSVALASPRYPFERAQKLQYAMSMAKEKIQIQSQEQSLAQSTWIHRYS